MIARFLFFQNRLTDNPPNPPSPLRTHPLHRPPIPSPPPSINEKPQNDMVRSPEPLDIQKSSSEQTSALLISIRHINAATDTTPSWRCSIRPASTGVNDEVEEDGCS